VGLKVVLTL